VRGAGSIITDTGTEWILNCNWDKPEDFFLPKNTQVVTIKADTNGSEMGGILASFSNHEVTDETWLCGECTSFNSSLSGLECMKNATTFGDNGTHSIPKPPSGDFSSGEAAKAQWIWVENVTASHVWCMKEFGKLRKFMDAWGCRGVGTTPSDV
jgi:hypothetical protein